MLNPNDIVNMKFEKAAFGYKPEEVDSFLEEIMVSYKKLYEEKTSAEEKMEVLAAKVEEYRESEDSLKTVLVGAQKLGDNIIRDAKAKAEVIVNDAENQMKQVYSESEAKIVKEKETLQNLQKKTADFKKNLLAMYKQHLELIRLMPEEENEEEEEPVSDVEESAAFEDDGAAIQDDIQEDNSDIEAESDTEEE